MSVRIVRLYPEVEVSRQSFKRVKRVTVPNQSMSLREVLRRYVRREPLPGSNDGVYEERFGDLEKMAKADIVVQMEHVEDLKAKIKRVRDKEIAKLDARKKELEAKQALEAQSVPTPVQGGTPIKTPGTPSPS